MKVNTIMLGITLLTACQTSVAQTANPLPAWALGGFVRPEGRNPIIEPNAVSKFYCPMRADSVAWEESDTFNPAAVVKNGNIYVLYRAEDNSATGIGKRTSRIGLATSSDGIAMMRQSVPVLYPDTDAFRDYEWEGGCEDPRVAVTEDGTYVMFYTGWNRGHGSTARLCVATSTNLTQWTKHGPAFAKAYDGRFANMACKSGSIVTQLKNGQLVITQVNGHYLMYWGEDFVAAATSDNLIDWTPVLGTDNELLKLIKPRNRYFDSALTECGPPAIITENGILLLYNGKNKTDGNADERFATGTYSAGQVLFSLANPYEPIARLDVPFFRPMADFEKSGQYKDGTVFIEGLTYYQNKWFLYYGCADSKVGVAIYDPTQPQNGDPIGNEQDSTLISNYPLNGIGKQIVSIHSSSGEAANNERAFNLLYNHINSGKKWCENSNEHPWVIFELNDYYNLTKFSFRDVAPYENGNGNVPEYWIYVSTTGTNDNDFIEVIHRTDQGSVDVKTDELPVPAEARYVKFVATRGTRTDNGNPENAIRIYGFEIYGTFSRNVERGQLLSVGKTLMDYYDAITYAERPLHLLDGNTTLEQNKWCFARAGENDSLKYALIDLEDEYLISQFKIYDTRTLETGNDDYNLLGYNLYISTQKPDLSLINNTLDKNTCWNKVVDAQGRGADSIKIDNIESQAGRYVKFEIPRSRTAGTARIYALEVYGTTITNTTQPTLIENRIWPQPLNAGYAILHTAWPQQQITIFDEQGRQIETLYTQADGSLKTNLQAGLYFVHTTNGQTAKLTVR